MPADPTPADTLIIPYGVARVTPDNLCHAAQVEIDTAAQAPLRLGDGPYRRSVVAEEADDPFSDSDASVGAARLDILRRLHLRDCDVFDKYLRLWIDLYFDFVAAQVSEFGVELQALARAPEFVAVDAALWDGHELIAIVFAGGEKARRAQGLAGRARLLTVDPLLERVDETAAADVIVDQLGDSVSGFWRGLAVPPDPFGPAPFRFGRSTAPSF